MFKSFQARKTTLILCLGLTLLLAVLGLTINPKADTHKVYAWGESVTCTSVKEEYLQWDYLNLYQIKPNTHFSYSSNSDGYNGYALARAFDGNFDTAFVGTKTINYNSTVQINAVFKKTTTVDRIIYKCASFDGKPSGFPTYLRLSWGSNYGESTFLQIYNVTTDIVMFIFNQPITTDRLRFEFADVCVNNNSVSGTFSVATAAELMFLQPENQYAAKAGDLFTDYRWTELKSEYKNIDMLHDMKTQLSGYINYDTEFGPRIERALALMEGTLQYDPAREFTTDGAGINKIQQYGDIGRYARNTLLMQYMGINRQVTGIYQNANKTINIWVDAPEGVPLPWIETVQYKEHYWSLKDTFTLHRGRNVITMSDFVGKDRDLYKNFTVSGGSIYIINPYTPDEQPGGVKIYIEGGYRYPVMTYETGVEQYRAELDAYVKLVNDNPNDYADITELVANHAILTFPAGKANGYYQSKHNPRGVMESWDAMIEEMFAFDGIALNEGEEHYDDKNKHLYINVRTVQPTAGAAAYAYGDTIGLPDFLDSGMVGSFGWGITHEVGHTIDMPVRMLSETTNNVPTKYYDLMHGSKRGSFTTIRNSLTSDLVDTTDFWKGHTGFWEFWWDIESVIPGYWAKMENLYRYEPRQGVNEKTELLVYLSSLATGQDLCYYFERWGFSFNTANPFKYENASQNFKNAMQAAKNAGRINSDKQYKFWYVDDTVYNYVAVQKGASIYNLSFTPAIDSIVKVGGGYKIVFPKSNNNGHLGYEILQGNDRDGYKVIAFADGDSYIDTTSYPEGYAPSYKIVAYDKKLEHSSESSAVTVETTVSNPVCRVNGDNYGSLRDAMFAASAGSTIYLLADAWDVDIDIPFSVTIVIDQTVNGNITLTKGGDGAMFNLKKGATLTLQGETNRKIIVDGSLSQSGPIFNSEGGNISATNVKFTNCKSNSAGAVIVSNGGSLELVNCSFNNCTAPVGGAIYANGASVTITSCEFADCNAQDNGENLLGYNGGALYLVGCGVVTIKSSNFSACTATSSNGQVEQKNGGAIYAEGCKNIEIDSTTFSNCEATCGGAIYLTQSTVTLKNSCSITGCSAMDGGGIFIAEESTLTITRGTLTDNTATGNGGAVFVDATSSLSVNNLSTLSRNTATNYGGAIACEGTIKQIIGDENTSYLKRMLMEYNTAQYGGAIALIGGAQITTMQNVTLMNNNADYGAGMYIEGSAWLRENIMISRNTASQFGGGIYFKGGDSGTLNFNSNSTSVGSKPELYNDSAPIGYELYMESGNLQLLKVWFYFNYATAAKMPTEDEMKYSLYVNSGNVVIAGTATPSGGNRNLDAELTRDIFISQNATVHLTTAMFTIGPYIGPNPANMYQPFSYSDFHITLDSYDFDYVKVIFTADFEIPQDALTARDISFLNLDPSKGSIEIRGNTICYVPKQVKVTLDYGDEIGTESVMVENGSTYTFTADDFETKYPDKYIISFVVDGVTCHVGDSIAIDDMTVIQVVVGQKYKVTVSYGDNEEYIYVTPGEKFKFPSSSSAVDGNIIKWEYNDSYYDVGDEIDIDGDIVILPIKEGSLRVEFRVGDELLSVTYVDYAGTVTMPSLSEIEQGYELLGWYIDDTRYEVGETVSVTKDMTFVARIEKIKLTVVYYNSSQLIDSITVEYGDSITLLSAIELEAGYELVGWKLGDTEYTPGQQVTVTSNMRLVAMLTYQQPPVTKRTVSYYDGLTLISSQELEVGAELNPPTLSKEGYKFAGWMKNGELFNATTMPDEDLVLTASWAVDVVLLEAKIDALKNATTLQAKFDAIKAVEATLALYTDEEIATLNLAEYNALKAAFDALSANAVSDLAVAEQVGQSLTANIVTSVALVAMAIVEILKRRILG